MRMPPNVCHREAKEEFDEDESFARRAMSKKCKSVASRSSAFRRDAAEGLPRVEHLASAAVPLCAIQLNSAGCASVKLPPDFDGVALVMLSSERSCEWQILHVSSSPSASPPSMLQRQLCLNDPFPPDSHTSLQVIDHVLNACRVVANCCFASRRPRSSLLEKK